MKFRHLYYPIFLIVLICISYSNTLHSPFVYDDLYGISENRYIQIREISLNGLSDIIKHSYARSRPVSNITLALNYMYGGLDTFGYHAVNISIHILTAIFIYLLFLTIFRTRTLESYHDHAPVLAFAIAGLWSLNPVQTQAVTYIIQRMTSLATMFYIISFYCYVKASAKKAHEIRGKSIFYGLAFLASVLAMGSKEIAITLPLVFLLYEYFVFVRNNEKSMRGLMKKVLFLTICTMVIALAYIKFQNPLTFIEKHLIGEIVSFNIQDGQIGITQKIMTEARVIFYYISLFLFPHPSRQMLLYDYPVSSSLFAPLTTIISIITFFSLIFLAFRLKKKPLISFFILWYFTNLMLESTVIKLHLVFEHRLYLPSVGIAAIVILLLWKGARRYNISTRPVVGACHILFIMLAFMTYNRNGIWRDDVTLYEDNLRKNPNSSTIHYNLAVAYGNRPDMWKEAIREYELIMDKNLPESREANNSMLHYNIAVAYSRDPAMWDKALKEYETAITADPANYKAYYNKGLIYNKRKNYKDASTYFEKAANIEKNNYQVRMSLAFAYYQTGNIDMAIKHVSRATMLERKAGGDKKNDSPFVILGDLYTRNKDFKLAAAAYKKALNETPGNPEVLYKLENLFRSTPGKQSKTRELPGKKW